MADAIVEISCKDWPDFKSTGLLRLYGGNAFVRGRYLFRGQSSANYRLESSFDRWHSQSGINTTRPIAERRLMELFKEEIRNSSAPQPADVEDPEKILALAQHYGIPTRLLDWTESPYIASFFAFSSIHSALDADAKIAIWCLDRQHPIWSEDKGVQLMDVDAGPYNERLRRQLGKFTHLSSPFDTLDEHLVHCKPRKPVAWKLTIPASEANRALSDLDFMGINYSAIYPGIDGCARAANLRMILEQQKPPRLEQQKLPRAPRTKPPARRRAR